MIYTIFFILFIHLTPSLYGYGQPSVNLGYTNILDGGPVRPQPGFYLQNFSIYYYTNTFLDHQGKKIPGLDGASLNAWAYAVQSVYQFNKISTMNSMPGISFVVPLTCYSAISPNKLGTKSSGSGIGSISFGPYLQWTPVFLKDRHFFIHRLACDLIMPSAKNKSPKKQINPGEAFLSVCPYWAGTIYASEKLAFSWRLSYVWSAQSRKINFKAGDATFFNYSIEYQLIPHLWTAVAGYYFQQISNNKLNGLTQPHSRERVFGIGPGAGYFFSPDLIFFTYFYTEFKVLNREQGLSFILRLVKHF